jgi:FHS family L-fucose permease-like MFS transporter
VYNIVAMSIFLASRFLTTWLMKFMDAKKLLLYFALGGVLTMIGTIFIEGHFGLYCLVATSAFMSLMFPTIYGIALEGLGNDSTYGSAGLVMAIVGGALMPPLQGAVIDLESVGSMDAVRISFVIPLISFMVIAGFGYLNVRGRLSA